MFLIVGGSTVKIMGAKILKEVQGLSRRRDTDQPLFYLALLALLLRLYFFLPPFLLEQMYWLSSDNKKYLIDKSM